MIDGLSMAVPLLLWGANTLRCVDRTERRPGQSVSFQDVPTDVAWLMPDEGCSSGARAIVDASTLGHLEAVQLTSEVTSERCRQILGSEPILMGVARQTSASEGDSLFFLFSFHPLISR